MATTLTGATVSSTYDALIKIGDNGPVTGTLKVLSDGLGNDLPVQISTSTMKITGTLDVTTGILTVATPTANTHATTKIYVDTLVGNEETARITADSNLQSQITANALDISNLENGVGTVSSINTLDGDITLTSGSGASVSVAGQTITISATGTGVQSIAVTAPLTSTGGTTPTIGIPIVTQSAAGAMSATDKQKLDGIAAGAEVNVQANWTETNTSSDAFILNKPTIVSAVNGTAPITVSGTTTRTVAISAATTSAAGSMSAADKTKLDGIAAGAEVNVNADWNAVSGDAQILNKPTIVSSVTGTAPIVSSGGTNPAISISAATTLTDGSMSAGDKLKLDGIQTGAEVNQNAYSNFTVGATTISANSKTDTLTLIAGTNITLTPNAGAESITISSTGGGGGSSTLDGLTDVTITAPVDHEALVYDEATTQWINGAPKAVDVAIYNGTGVTINAGQLLKAVGAVGDKVSVGLFDLDVDSPKYLIGVAASTILNGGNGYARTIGELRGISTDIYPIGTVLYASGTAGALSDTPGDPEIPVAIVTRSQANTGRLYIRCYVPGAEYPAFRTISVTGQSDILADSPNGDLNVAGTNGISLTTNATTDTLTVSQNFINLSALSGGAILYWDGTAIVEDSNISISSQSQEFIVDYVAYFNQGIFASGTASLGDAMLVKDIVVDKAVISGAGSYGIGSRVIKNTFTGTSLQLGRVYTPIAGGTLDQSTNASVRGEGMQVMAINASGVDGVLKEGMVRVSGTPFTGATVGDKVYLSTNGLVTTTAPTTGILRILGYVVDTTAQMMYFNPDNTYINL